MVEKLNGNSTNRGHLLPASFYLQEDVVAVARALLGKYLVTDFDGHRCSGRIVETEAYRGPDDRACHAYGNRCTDRTRVMFEAGGAAYVYLCYGIHHLFNVVSGPVDRPHAVLIRAVEPVDNVDQMMRRRGVDRVRPQLTAGPGVLTRALGIHTGHSGLRLTDEASPIWLEDRGDSIPANRIASGPRIGVDYAGECATWPWRFYLPESAFVSKKR